MNLKIFITLGAFFALLSTTIILANKTQISRIASPDETRYSLQLETFTPTPQPTASLTTPPFIPTLTSILYTPYTPPVDNGTCTPNSWITNGCTCTGTRHIYVYCDNTQPPQPPGANTGCIIYPPPHDNTNCERVVREHPNCKQWCELKPVIYLYPPTKTLVDVSIDTPGRIYVSDPQIETKNTWTNVTAFPDGSLIYKGKTYTELFYEIEHKTLPVPTEGFTLSSSRLSEELHSYLLRYGLTEKETQEFLQWWIPPLQKLHTPYIFFSVFPIEQKETFDKIVVNPVPNNTIEVIAYFKGLDKTENVPEPIIPNVPPRSGFTMVSWGGILAQ